MNKSMVTLKLHTRFLVLMGSECNSTRVLMAGFVVDHTLGVDTDSYLVEVLVEVSLEVGIGINGTCSCWIVCSGSRIGV